MGIKGSLTYTGSLGPVSGQRRLCLCIYADADLRFGLGCYIYSSNGATYQLTTVANDSFFLVAFLDVQRNDRLDPNEPYEIYHDRAAAPADPVTAGPGFTTADITFGDENLPVAPTPTQTPEPTARASAELTATSTQTATATSSETPQPTSTQTPQPSTTQTSTETPTHVPTPNPCNGDCDASGEVTIDEIITMVNVALGSAAPSVCTAGDSDGSGMIEINEIIQAVNNAGVGCALAN